MDRVDLHIHTTASDGTVEPEQIPALAMQAGLRAIAVTDHDTVAAVETVQRCAEPLGLEVLAGIEVSAFYRRREIHILGYHIDIHSSAIAALTEHCRAQRRRRNERMVEAMERDGFDISMQKLTAAFPGTVIGRPHMARMLIEKGYAVSVNDAFNKYLSWGKPYFVSRELIGAREAIDAIRQGGGIAVLAHPMKYRYEDADLPEIFRELKSWGVAGVEALYSRHTPPQTELLLALAKESGLIVTGGSDFHGDNKPDIAMGTGLGDLFVGYEAVEKLRRVKVRGEN